ncbi:MAG: hypothetical protein WCV73_00875 [Patescibacteria group bacterium]|jgi:hypothetical protein
MLTKAEKRQKILDKAKSAPKGATLAGQIAKAQTSKGYAKRKKTIKF